MQFYINPISKGKYRNYPCICGSGKKAKKCHGFKSKLSQEEYTEYADIILIHNTAVMRMEQANKEK